MNPTLLKTRTHCPQGHDLSIYGYYFGSNQRCGECNRAGTAGRRPTPKKTASTAENHESDRPFSMQFATNSQEKPR